MTRNEFPPASCGETTGHRAHRHFGAEGASRPCSGEAYLVDDWQDPEGDDLPMHFRADGSLHTGLTDVPVPALYTPDNPGYGRTVHFEHEGRVVSGTVRGIVFGAGRHAVTVFSADLGHTHTIDHGITVDVADLLPAPDSALTDEQRDGWRRELTAEARALAPELFDDTSAPTLADDVAALRAMVMVGWWEVDEVGRDEALNVLDRIAGAVPQRAMGTRGEPLWLHSCGETFGSERSPGRVCAYCDDRPEPESWRALYVLSGTA